MNAFEWFAIGLICFIGALGFALTLLSINGRSEAEDAEQRRTVSKPAPLGNEWDAEKLREKGWL